MNAQRDIRKEDENRRLIASGGQNWTRCSLPERRFARGAHWRVQLEENHHLRSDLNVAKRNLKILLHAESIVDYPQSNAEQHLWLLRCDV